MTGLGEGVSGDAVEVTVTAAETLTSLVPPALNWTVTVPVLALAQPAATATV